MNKNKQKATLSRKQLQAIPLIIESKTISGGLKTAGLNRSTFYLWMKQDSFKAEFEKQIKFLLDESSFQLKQSFSQAATVMDDLLWATNESVRLRAAQGVIDNVMKFSEFENILKKLNELEVKINAKFEESD